MVSPGLRAKLCSRMDLNNPNVPPSTPPNVPPGAPATPPGAPPPPQYGAGYRPPYLPPQPPRQSRTWLWVLIGGGAFFLFVLAVFTLVYVSLRTDRNAEFSGFGDKIGVIDLEGVIINPEETVKHLKKFGDDSSIKAIIVHVNSPGGGAAASEEIYREMRRVRDEKKKKLVVSIETVGASGAYYVAAGANRIYANDASIVGSIGVIAEWYNYEDLLKWAKLKNIVIKTGEFKDTGNPARELTPAEREYLQGMVNNMKEQFVSAVSDGRQMDRNSIESIANGKVWTGKEAKEMKLVDEIGDFEKCVKDTANAVGIHGEPTLVKPEKEKRTLSDLLFGDLSDIIPSQAKMMDSHVGFYYLWK
jgi:protease IV